MAVIFSDYKFCEEKCNKKGYVSKIHCLDMTNKKKRKNKSIARYAFKFLSFIFIFWGVVILEVFTKIHVWYDKIISVAKLDKIFSAHALCFILSFRHLVLLCRVNSKLCHLVKHILHKREWSCKRLWHHDWNISRGQLHLQSCL